jgi:enamine deaminase RidA (YjgF/YER057c/UK114 family)
MRSLPILAGLIVLVAAAPALAKGPHKPAPAPSLAPVTHVGPANSPIASAAFVPAGYGIFYVSGQTPPALNADAPKGTPPEFGDTKTQTLGIMKKIQDILKAQGLTMGDVVMMRVYLAGDPAKGGKMDFAGMMESYNPFFGTADQPNKPARVTVQVASLVAPGMLAEIEVQAAKKP